MRILNVVAAFGWGGTERQFVNLALGLDRTRFDVRFGCLRRFGMMLNDLERNGVTVIDYRISSFRSLRLPIAQWRLARDVRRLGIDIVHTYGVSANLFAILPAKLAGAAVVASIRDMGVYLSPAQRRLQRLVCRFADRVLVNAEAIKKWLIEDGFDGERIHVIPNGIDVDAFTASIPKPDTPLVAALGRISRGKGLEDFIAAAAKVAPQFPQAQFLIIGEPSFTTRGGDVVVDESYTHELRALAERYGVAERVIFTGFRSDVAHILSRAAISVLPSHSEGLSNTLLESMAAGVPVVATRVGGTAEVIRDSENGLLVNAGDRDALAAAIARLLGDAQLAKAIGAAARSRIAAHYSVQQLVERTSRFYESMLDHKGTAAAPEVAEMDA